MTMIYVQQCLVPEEKVIFGGYFHWFYTLSAALWLLVGIVLAIGVLIGAVNFHYGAGLPGNLYIDAVWDLNIGYRLGAFALFLFGLFQFAMMMVVKATTEIAVTNRRLIYKRGLIARHIDEMSIDRIEGVIVQQGIIGRIFAFGRVVVRGMGVGAVVLPPMIMRPIDFRKAIEHAKEV